MLNLVMVMEMEMEMLVESLKELEQKHSHFKAQIWIQACYVLSKLQLLQLNQNPLKINLQYSSKGNSWLFVMQKEGFTFAR
jgi:hypothetical protein